MSDQTDELYDLLVKKAIYGLDEAEEQELARLDPGTAADEFQTLEMVAAAIGLADLEVTEMPAHLRQGIVESAGAYFTESANTVIASNDGYVREPSISAYEDAEPNASSSWFGWLGWAVAAAAIVALVVSVWFRQPAAGPEVGGKTTPTPTATPKPIAPTEMRDELARTATDLIKATWAAGNVKGLTDVVGDIIWSDEKQSGYMTFKGLPANDPSKETYQLWIMDENQGDVTPIDGGTFDVNANGEVVVPINAKLKAKAPHLFAVTIEKPGGVVVSKRERIAAIAKVETPKSPTT